MLRNGSDNQNYATDVDTYTDPDMDVITDGDDEDDPTYLNDNAIAEPTNAEPTNTEPTNAALNEPAPSEEVEGDDNLLRAMDSALAGGFIEEPMILHAISNN